jgi:Na+/H+-dicarboxylate symporter
MAASDQAKPVRGAWSARRHDLLLTLLILGSLVLGVLVGQFFLFSDDPSVSATTIADRVAPYQQIGEFLFFRPLMMLVIPLVFTSVVVGVTSIGNPQRLGLIGGATLVYYFTTMILAVLLGLVLVNTVKPGRNADPSAFISDQAVQSFAVTEQAISARSETGVGGAIINLLEQAIPSNPIAAAASGNTLSMVTVATLFGLALVLIGEAGKPAVAVMESIFAALIKLVTLLLWLAPIGVFCLVAARVGTTGLGALAGPLGKYAMVVIVGLLIHSLVLLPIVTFLFGRANPYRFLLQMRKPLLTAFSTASSAATLPVSIEEAERSGGCSKKAANFVLPLGATVNMDGTALYQAVAVVFLFQMHPSFEPGLTQMLVILITAVLAAIGAAGIPSAGLVTMAIVITAVNRSLEAMNADFAPLPLSAIAIILGVDRFLDMCRTAVNVWGDLVGAKIITRIAPDDET